MSPNPQTERCHVAKKQKTFYLNEELDQVVDAVAQTTGGNFTKIVTAALIQYLFGDLDQPDPCWMRLAVALERKDLTLPDILVDIARGVIEQKDLEWEINVEAAKKAGRTHSGLDHTHEIETGAIRLWIELVENARKEDRPLLDAIITEYTKRVPRTS